MSADERLIEIMSELLQEVQGLRGDVRDVKSEVAEFRQDTNTRFEKLEKAVDNNTDTIAKLQLSASELRLSNMALAREIENVLDLDRRLKIVEAIVLNQAS